MKKKFFSKITGDFAQGPHAGIIACALTPPPPSYFSNLRAYYYVITI